MPTTDDALRREAARLHELLFDRAIPEDLADRYVELDRGRLRDAPVALRVSVDRILAHSLDVEALELALRLRERNNSLTRKLHALCYLAEARAAYFDRFVRRRDGVLGAWAALAVATLRSAYKLLKGRYLLWRHRVV